MQRQRFQELCHTPQCFCISVLDCCLFMLILWNGALLRPITLRLWNWGGVQDPKFACMLKPSQPVYVSEYNATNTFGATVFLSFCSVPCGIWIPHTLCRLKFFESSCRNSWQVLRIAELHHKPFSQHPFLSSKAPFRDIYPWNMKAPKIWSISVDTLCNIVLMVAPISKDTKAASFHITWVTCKMAPPKEWPIKMTGSWGHFGFKSLADFTTDAMIFQLRTISQIASSL